MDQKKLDEILDKHKKWLAGEPDGERALLRHSDLSGSNLSHSDLSGCNLSDSNLSNCNLSGCDLIGCNLSGCKGIVSPIQYMDENSTGVLMVISHTKRLIRSSARHADGYCNPAQ